MATQQATLRVVTQHRDDTSESPSKTQDETFTLQGYDGITFGQIYKLPAAAVDVAITFTAPIGLTILSHDNPFKYRLFTGETLIGPVIFCCPGWAPDEDAAITARTSILLTGNGDTPSRLEFVIVEKP